MALRERYRDLLLRVRGPSGATPKGRPAGGRRDATDSALIEALAFVGVLDAAGALGLISSADRAELKQRGAPLLLRAPEDEDTRLALGLARVGYGILTGRSTRESAHGLHPTDRSLLEMRQGAPEPLVAASVAAHVRGCGWCKKRNEIAALADSAEVIAGGDGGRVAVAAKGRMPVRAPGSGHKLCAIEGLGVELVLFDEPEARRLAAYAVDSSAPLQLVSASLEAESSEPGYWLGRVEGAARTLDATVKLGRKKAQVQLELPSRRKKPKR